jgi:monoamine oxidase
MIRLSRRTLLAGSAAWIAAPAILRAASGEYDVAVVGAGAAGLAAARKLAANSRRVIVIEAASRPGGRIASAARPSGALYDKGANRFSASRRNPLIAVAREAKLGVYDPPAGKRLYVGDREARDNEYDDFIAALGRANRTVAAVAELGRDIAASRALPELGDWQGTVSFLLGPQPHGKELDAISALDLSRLEERHDDVMIREGTAALMQAAAKPLEIEFNTAVQAINLAGRGVQLATDRGAVSARAAIVTASTGVLGSGRIRFAPGLPQPVTDAVNRLSLGTHERAIFDLPGNPYRFNADERVVFKTKDARGAMFTMRAGGSDVAYADFGGELARELWKAGDGAIADYVVRELAAHFGGGTRPEIGRIEVTRWSAEPFVLGGTSAAAPGAGASRRALTLPVHERLFIAGEAAHETMWGTVAGAALSGERAADQALAYLAGVEKPAPAATHEPARKRRR